MTPERKNEIDNELSFIISCLYQRGEEMMANTLETDIMELWNYINDLENS